jgi:hypothetical protein
MQRHELPRSQGTLRGIPPDLRSDTRRRGVILRRARAISVFRLAPRFLTRHAVHSSPKLRSFPLPRHTLRNSTDLSIASQPPMNLPASRKALLPGARESLRRAAIIQ